MTRKSSEAAFVSEAIDKKGGVFKYPKVFQYDTGPEFKNEVTKLLEKHNVDILRAKKKNTSILIRYLWKPLTRS